MYTWWTVRREPAAPHSTQRSASRFADAPSSWWRSARWSSRSVEQSRRRAVENDVVRRLAARGGGRQERPRQQHGAGSRRGGGRDVAVLLQLLVRRAVAKLVIRASTRIPGHATSMPTIV